MKKQPVTTTKSNLSKPHLDGAKEHLTDWWLEEGNAEGKKFETAEATCQFSSTDVYDTIDTMAVYERLKELGRPEDLWQVVKPDLAALKKVMGESDIRALQGPPTGVKVSIRLKLKEV
ncbi:MAG: hypothetical protein ACNA7J_14070 [Wenzhouxiangella sp.]